MRNKKKPYLVQNNRAEENLDQKDKKQRMSLAGKLDKHNKHMMYFMYISAFKQLSA